MERWGRLARGGTAGGFFLAVNELGARKNSFSSSEKRWRRDFLISYPQLIHRLSTAYPQEKPLKSGVFVNSFGI